jgi:hypothetical protein
MASLFLNVVFRPFCPSYRHSLLVFSLGYTITGTFLLILTHTAGDAVVRYVLQALNAH